jgi:hypothetical protein
MAGMRRLGGLVVLAAWVSAAWSPTKDLKQTVEDLGLVDPDLGVQDVLANHGAHHFGSRGARNSPDLPLVIGYVRAPFPLFTHRPRVPAPLKESDGRKQLKKANNCEKLQTPRGDNPDLEPRDDATTTATGDAVELERIRLRQGVCEKVYPHLARMVSCPSVRSLPSSLPSIPSECHRAIVSTPSLISLLLIQIHTLTHPQLESRFRD